MKEVKEYIKEWIKIIDEGGSFSGHGFMSGFPQPYKGLIPSCEMNGLYMAVNLIAKYGKLPINKSFYLSFLSGDRLVIPEGFGENKDLLWNLYYALKIIDQQLNTPNP